MWQKTKKECVPFPCPKIPLWSRRGLFLQDVRWDEREINRSQPSPSSLGLLPELTRNTRKEKGRRKKRKGKPTKKSMSWRLRKTRVRKKTRTDLKSLTYLRTKGKASTGMNQRGRAGGKEGVPRMILKPLSTPRMMRFSSNAGNFWQKKIEVSQSLRREGWFVR